MFNKKNDRREKHGHIDAFESLLLSFEPMGEDTDSVTFKMVCATDNKCSIFLTIDRTDKNIELFVDHVPYIPFFKEHVGTDGSIISYILTLKDFLSYAIESSIKLEGDKLKSASYEVISEFKDVKIKLSFKESDMYPSISKYITSTAADAIYKKTL